MTFYEKFIAKCSEFGVAPSNAMEEMGLNRSTLTGWKQGKSVPSDFVVGLVAKYFDCPLEELTAARAETQAIRAAGKSKRKRSSVLDDPKMVPQIGTIACGNPITAYENMEELVPLPPRVRADFALKCRGESMINAHIFDGDVVYIRQQPIVENGEIAAVLIGDEATLKRVYIYKNRLTLMPENPMYDPINLIGEEMEQVTILGKAVAAVNFLNGEGKKN